MLEAGKQTRLKVWIRAVLPGHWGGKAGRWFRGALIKIARFGRDELKLPEKTKSIRDAAWAHAEGATVGTSQAEALLKWQEAESKRIEVQPRQQTLDDSVQQVRVATEKLKAEAEKAKAETEKLNAEAEKLRAEASSLRVDAAIKLVDRLVAARVWIVPDSSGGFHLVPLPKNADVSQLYPELIPEDLLSLDAVGLGYGPAVTFGFRFSSPTTSANYTESIRQQFRESPLPPDQKPFDTIKQDEPKP